ncbi:MAG: hypothetical protein BACD_02269 [Bacteroides rodentium]
MHYGLGLEHMILKCFNAREIVEIDNTFFGK